MGLCQKCRSIGLPVYPVRYTVAPEYIMADLPSWAENKQLPTLSKYSKYALRTMRKGYLYVFCQYEDNSIDLEITVYKVDEQGGFWQQDISKELDLLRFGDSVSEKQQSVPLNDMQTTCNNSAHLASNIAFITLAKPEKCETAWLAYSEHKWSTKTIKQYLNDEDKRNLRMQAIKPKQWLNCQQSNDGITTANQEAIASTMDIQEIEDTLEKKTTKLLNFSTCKYTLCFPYLYGNKSLDKVPLSEFRIPGGPTFSYNRQLFKKRSTLSPWQQLPKEGLQLSYTETYSAYLNKKMQSAERNNTGSPPMMVALIDSIGIAAELSNWGNSVLNSFKKIIAERQRENAACSGIAFLEEAVKNSDFSKSEQEFKEHIKKTNKKYLSDAKYFNSKNYHYDSGILGVSDTSRMVQWDDKQKAQGQRVINIVNKSNDKFISLDPNLTEIERYINGITHKAKNLVQFINDNYLIKEIGEEKHARIFDQIFALDKSANIAQINSLTAELKLMEVEFTGKAKVYETNWHKQNKTEMSAQKRWKKYDVCLSHHYKEYKKQYATFLKDTESYISALLDDLISWIDCAKLKDKHPFSLSADDLFQDDDNYLAFANDILMTLGMQATNNKITQLFTHFIEDEALESHNIIWSAVFANRKMDKAAQQKCVSLLLSLDKTSELKSSSYGELLDQLETVLEFYQGESKESDVLIELGDSIDKQVPSIFNSQVEHKKLDTTKEFLEAFKSERNTLMDDNSTDAKITAAALQPIKKASSAVVIALLNYLSNIGGNVLSQMAQSFYIAATPGTVSKKSMKAFLQKYDSFVKELRKSMKSHVSTAGEQFANGTQILTDQLKKCITNKKVGAGFAGAILGIHIVKIFSIVTDSSLKTQAQQSNANAELTMAITASIAASFNLLAIYGENGRFNAKQITRIQFSGNFFGFIAGIIEVGINWHEDTSDKQGVEKTLYYVSFFSLIVSTIDLFLQMGKTSLLQLVDRGIATLAALLLERSLIRFAITTVGRICISLFALALNPWIALGIFLIQLAIELNKPDDMQVWLTHCCFGIGQDVFNSEYYHRYKTAEVEMKALEAIFKKYEQALKEYYDEQAAERAKRETPVFTPGEWQVLRNPPFIH